MTSYLNYQSSELSKALLLFSKSSTIKRDDVDCINYLKILGTNCMGGKIAKFTIPKKLEWVNDNIDNIINYDNNILVSQASDKLLFLVFCMEYKRYYEFQTNENIYEFLGP